MGSYEVRADAYYRVVWAGGSMVCKGIAKAQRIRKRYGGVIIPMNTMTYDGDKAYGD